MASESLLNVRDSESEDNPKLANNWASRSLRAFPAASNGEFDLPADLATVIASGNGCEVQTACGRTMLDFSMGWGSVLLGHADSKVLDAVKTRLDFGSNFAAVTATSLELAEEIIRVSPACEQLRFCASGTEATMYCLRLARAFTGRTKVIRFEGAYHGAHDVGVTSMFPKERLSFPTPEPSSDGLISHQNGGVLVAPFNDLAETQRILEEAPNDIACVIVEPLQRCLPPVPGFLAGLRELAHSHGALLVFDEVVTGFRMAYGGAQEYYGVQPDLVAYGKALGGGFPIGCFGGREEIMRLASESRSGRETYTWTASTLGGNPISAAAALATLGRLREPGVYDRLHQLGRYLRDGMRQVVSDLELDAHILGDGPLAQIALTSQEPCDYRSSQHRDKALARRVMLGLFGRGIWLNPMGTKLYLSLAHSEESCDRLTELLADTLKEVLEPT